MSRPHFPGFPPEALTFFRGLEKNNDREWFQERKELFETKVRRPMLELVESLNGVLVTAAPDFVTEPAKSVYRIYRDTRFSADKTPYKTHIAAVFNRRGFEKNSSAGLYFSVSHKEIEVGGGVYMPTPEQLLAIRTYLAEHHAEFRKLLASKAVKSTFGEMTGDALQRVPKGFDPEHPAADLIKRKQWLLFQTLEPKLAVTPELHTELSKRLKAMIPFVEFLNRPLGKVSAKRAAEKKVIEDLLL